LAPEKQVIIENRNFGLFTVFIGLWLIGWTAITGTMIYALLFDNNGRYTFLFLVISILLIIGYMIWHQFLWNVRGKHILTFYENYLEIKKGGTISIFPSREVKYIEIKRFDSTHSREKNFFGSVWGFGGETLAGKCRGYDFYVAAGWKIEDSALLAIRLNEILERIKTKHNNTFHE
jgi:hypothetical protein